LRESNLSAMLPNDVPENLAAAVGLADLDRRLEQLVSIPDESDRVRFAMMWPVLLAPAVRSQLRKDLARSDRITRDMRDALDFLDRVARDFHEHRVHYDPGAGPIERVWTAKATGTISEDDSATILRSALMAAVLHQDYVFAVCEWLLARILDTDEEWLDSDDFVHNAEIAQMLAQATDALPASPEATLTRHTAYLTWARVTGPALVRFPDARVYRRVVQAGNQIVAEALKQGDSEFAGDMLQELALILVATYIRYRTTVAYVREINTWRDSLHNALGPEASVVAAKVWRMPSASVALKTAARLLRTARDYRDGGAQRRTELVFTEVLEFLSLLRVRGAAAELLELGEDLLPAIDRTSDALQWVRLLARLHAHGRRITQDELDDIRGPSLDQRITSLGTAHALDFVRGAAGVFQDIDPQHALTMLRDARELLDDSAESALLMHWKLELSLLLRLGDPSLDAASLRAAGAASGWDVERVALGLLRIACTTDNRDEALKLLDELVTLAPVLAGIYHSPLAMFRANVLANRAPDGAAGIEDCIRASELYLDLHLTHEALAALDRLRQLTGGPAGAVPSAERLPACSFLLEQRLGLRATPVVQAACAFALTAQSEHLTVDNFLAVTQAAKGLRFASVLGAGLKNDWASDRGKLRLLSQVKEAEAAIEVTSVQTTVATASPHVLRRGLPDELLLLAYAGPETPSSASTIEDRLAAAQQAFDARISALTLQSVGTRPPYVLRLQDIQLGLDDQVILLVIYIGETPTENGKLEPEIYNLLITRDDALFVGRRFSGGPARIVVRRGTRVMGHLNFSANPVMRCRENVLRDPGPWPVSPDDPDSMAAAPFFLEPILDRLAEERRRGRDHLCIVPHGPLHFHPFHLCGPPDSPLADDWTVTYLPNLRLLTPRGGVQRPRRHRPTQLTAVGLGFEQHQRRHLPPIPDAVAEAVDIAGVFGTEAVTESRATKDRVIAALENSRFVHLSTHGEHHVAAPAFQCVYLANCADADDRLAAHELLTLDLRGLEVLSLSSCESGLGRVDSADNLQGVPASALLAGVETLLVTLWPVSADCSRLFFTLFYARLRDRYTRRQAFAAAQKATREVYPQYRDWGAFVLMGDWM
jgi:hypothetical protein